MEGKESASAKPSSSQSKEEEYTPKVCEQHGPQHSERLDVTSSKFDPEAALEASPDVSLGGVEYRNLDELKDAIKLQDIEVADKLWLGDSKVSILFSLIMNLLLLHLCLLLANTSEIFIFCLYTSIIFLVILII